MTNIKKVLSFSSAVGSALVALPSKVLAGNTLDIVPGAGAPNVQGIRIGPIVQWGVTMLLGVAGVVAFIFLLWGGLQWILSGGDKEGTEKARKRITAALIGLAIVFSAYALIYIVGTVFGVNTFTFTIPQIGGGAAT